MNDLLQEQLRGLQQEYIRQLPARMEMLNALAEASHAHPLSVAQRMELQREAHQLAGTARSYGFADITQTARTLEEKLIDHPDANVTGYIEAVLESCKHAVLQLDGETKAEDPAASMTTKPRILVVDDDPFVHRLMQNGCSRMLRSSRPPLRKRRCA